jgi:ribosomal-protein-alanine N-acetyltransferase
MLTVSFTPFPELTTPRLRLRQMRATDAPALFLLRSDPGVMRYIPRPLAQQEADALALINAYNELAQKNEGINWAITEKEQDVLIGAIGFVHLEKEHFRAEVGYILSPAHQGKGMMQEALTAVVDYGFNTMQAHTLGAIIDPGNTASAALLERCGFVKEAHLRENGFHLGRFWDTVIYSRLAERK